MDLIPKNKIPEWLKNKLDSEKKKLLAKNDSELTHSQ